MKCSVPTRWQRLVGGFSFVLLSVVALMPTPANADAVVHANSENPGASINLSDLLAKDKNTLLFIHSPHCGPCRAIEPKIGQLSDKKSDLKIVDVLTDSEADSGINFMSPVGNQFEVYSVPMFIVYNPKGKKIMTGTKARKQVSLWLKENGIQE